MKIDIFKRTIKELVIFHRKSLELEHKYGIDFYETFLSHLFSVIDDLFECILNEDQIDMINDFIYSQSEQYIIQDELDYNINDLYNKVFTNNYPTIEVYCYGC